MKNLIRVYINNLSFGLPYYIFLAALTSPVALKFEDSMSEWFLSNLASMCIVSPFIIALIGPIGSKEDDGKK